MNSSLEIMKRHLGLPEEMELENGESIAISPLPAEFLPELLMAQAAMEKGEMSKEIIGQITLCITESLKPANPRGAMSEQEYVELIDTFTGNWFFPLMQKVFTMNRGGLTDKELDKVSKLKEKMDNGTKSKGDTSEVKKT